MLPLYLELFNFLYSFLYVVLYQQQLALAQGSVYVVQKEAGLIEGKKVWLWTDFQGLVNLR